MPTNLQKLTLLYDGSVKRVWKRPNANRQSEDLLWFEFTDDYSVFDWGKMPDRIDNKGRALIAIGSTCFDHLGLPGTFAELPGSAHLADFDGDWLRTRFAGGLFKRLASEKGAPHHFVRLADGQGETITADDIPSVKQAYMEVLAAEVIRPEPHLIMGETVFAYQPVPPRDGACPPRLIPLEVVFRFGMPAGSSLTARLAKDPAYATRLGLTSVPEPGSFFDRPVLEFYTKLEPKDRLLSHQEALLISGLTASRFEEMIELSFLLALALHCLCRRADVELWDGKFEFIETAKEIMLGDSIGPDELRLVHRGQSLSKEMIRHFYRGSRWEASLKEAQSIAAQRGVLDWRQVCEQELGMSPEPLSAAFKGVVDLLYGVLANALSGRRIFEDHPTLPEYVARTAAVLERERSR